MRNFSRTRAVPTSPVRAGDTQVTYEQVQPSQKSPFIEEFESSGIKTMDEVFRWSVNRYGARRFLGTREILGEDEEVQPNGKSLAKLELGEYRCFFFNSDANSCLNLLRWMNYEEADTIASNVGRVSCH